jgi:hypothetical protein
MKHRTPAIERKAHTRSAAFRDFTSERANEGNRSIPTHIRASRSFEYCGERLAMPTAKIALHCPLQ